MMDRRVMITGYGTVSGLGEAASAITFFEYLLARADDFPGRHKAIANRTIAELNAERFIDPNKLRRTDRLSQMAVIATELALQDARITIRAMNAERIGVIFNTCYGPFDTTETYVMKLLREGPRKAPAGIFPYTVQNAFTGLVTTLIGALGTNSTISGSSPAAYAFDMIREGVDDIMIAGGCDELTQNLVGGLADNRSSDDPVFSSATPLGEGAAVIILEEEEHALRRGVTPLAEILDYGIGNISGALRSKTYSSSDVIGRTMQQALRRSGVSADEIQICIAGTSSGTRLAHEEHDAMKALFPAKSRPAFIHPKAHLGDTLGASATFGAVAALGAMASSGVAASAGVKTGTCFAPEDGVQHALVNDLQLGGNLTSMVVRSYEVDLNSRGGYSSYGS